MASSGSEIDPNEGLTEYDMRRPLRPKITDDQTVAVDMARVNSELECPVCLGLISTAKIVQECLHRFCSDCIEKCLRQKRECPACRGHVASRRSLRNDEEFDKLIKLFHPNPAKAEAEDLAGAKNLAAMHRKKLFALAADMKAKMAKQQQKRAREARRWKRSYSESEDESDGEKSSKRARDGRGGGGGGERGRRGGAGGAGGGKSGSGARSDASDSDDGDVFVPDQINFRLMKYPGERRVESLAKQYLRTSPELKVSHIRKFLGKKLKFDQYHKFEIYLSLPGEDVHELPKEYTLRKVITKLAPQSEGNDLVLTYRLPKNF